MKKITFADFQQIESIQSRYRSGSYDVTVEVAATVYFTDNEDEGGTPAVITVTGGFEEADAGDRETPPSGAGFTVEGIAVTVKGEAPGAFTGDVDALYGMDWEAILLDDISEHVSAD